VTLHSSSGPLRAEKLHGDVSLEGSGATVDVRDISDAHVHVKTMYGLTLYNVHDGHVEVDSLSGNVTLNGVTGSGGGDLDQRQDQPTRETLAAAASIA